MSTHTPTFESELSDINKSGIAKRFFGSLAGSAAAASVLTGGFLWWLSGTAGLVTEVLLLVVLFSMFIVMFLPGILLFSIGSAFVDAPEEDHVASPVVGISVWLSLVAGGVVATNLPEVHSVLGFYDPFGVPELALFAVPPGIAAALWDTYHRTRDP